MMRRIMNRYLESAGIRVNGGHPWDIQVYDSRLFSRVFWQGSLGLGEAYLDGWWDCQALDEFFCRLLRSGIDRKFRFSPTAVWERVRAYFQNRPTIARTFALGKSHYSLRKAESQSWDAGSRYWLWFRDVRGLDGAPLRSFRSGHHGLRGTVAARTRVVSRSSG